MNKQKFKETIARASQDEGGGLDTIALEFLFKVLDDYKPDAITLNAGEVKIVVGFDGGTEEYYKTSVDEAIESLIDYGTKYVLVEKQIIPYFVAKWLEGKGSFLSIYGIFKELYDEESYCFDAQVRRWLNGQGNQSKLAEAKLYGYEIEEEPKYYALIKGRKSVETKRVFFSIRGEREVVLSNPGETDDVLFTKDKWNSVGITDSSADFKEENADD